MTEILNLAVAQNKSQYDFENLIFDDGSIWGMLLK